MSKSEFAKALIQLGWTQEWAGVMLECNERTVRSYVLGEHKVSFKAEKLIKEALQKLKRRRR